MQDTYISLDPKVADQYALERTMERFYKRTAFAESGIGAQTLPIYFGMASSCLVLANQPEKTRGLAGLTNRATLSKLVVLGLVSYYISGKYLEARFGDSQRKMMLRNDFFIDYYAAQKKE